MKCYIGSVLVQSAITNYHRLGDLNDKNLFLTVLEPAKSKIKMLADLVPGESSLPGLQLATFSLCSHKAEREKASSFISSYKGTNPFMRASPSCPNYLPVAPVCKHHRIGD